MEQSCVNQFKENIQVNSLDTENLSTDLSIYDFTNFILDICTTLIESGAHCERINRNIRRIAANSPYKVDMLLSFTAVSITTTDKNNNKNCFTANKHIKHHGAHFGVLTEISVLTWKLFENKISYTQLEKHIDEIKNVKKYSIWKIRFFIGIACACLCVIAGGNYIDALFTFVGSFIGLVVRQEMHKQHFNTMLCIICSSFVTTFISGIDKLYDVGLYPTAAIATSVLFLIPGVSLINSIIDIMEGYIPTGIARGVFGGFILLCIAIGMFLSMSLIGIDNF